MKIKKIEYPTPLESIEDIENGNIDVFVELEDGINYTLVVATPKNYYWYMEKEGLDYYYGSPDIIVKNLSKEVVEKAIYEYSKEDAYWLKYYHLAGIISIDCINETIKKEQDILNSILE